MFVRVVVLSGAVIYLTTRVAALHLNRRVTDGESIAQSSLQVSHEVLGFAERAVVNHHVNAERRLIR